MKRILFILHYPPPVHGSSVMGQSIKESKLSNNSFSCAYVNLSTSRTLDEVGKKSFKKVSRYIVIIYKVFKQILLNRPHLCYFAITVNGLPFKKDAFVALLIKFFGIKIIYHFHNKGVSTHQHNLIDNFLYHRVFKNSKGILLSEHLYYDVKKYIPKDKIYICPNGISDIRTVDFDDVEIKENRNTHNSSPVRILFLSNLLEAKGVFVLLNACKILQQKELSFKCTFVGAEGNISAEQFQQKVDQLNLADQVEYVGKKFGIEKEEMFAKSDLFVLPTENETFGLVNLEAMQHSLPVVSTCEGGIPDVVEDTITGYLVPKKDSYALAEKIEILIKNPDLRTKMGKAGREKYEKEFTLQAFETNLLNIFNQVLNESNTLDTH